MKIQAVLTLACLALALCAPRWSWAQEQVSLQDLEDESASYITELSELSEMENPEEVTAINLSNEQIEQFPKELLRFPNLRKLALSSQKLTDLAGIEQLTQLQYLDLYYCQELKTLPASLSKLTNLRFLNINSTGISEPMGVVSQLKNLEKLTMNMIPELKELKGIGNLTKLEHLEFSASYAIPIEAMPLELAKLTNLKSLIIGSYELENNNLQAVLSPLVNLESLELGSMVYETAPVFLAKLTKLKKLDIAGNYANFVVLTGWLDKLQALEELKLTYAVVDAQSAPLFAKLSNLTALNIQFSKSDAFPSLPANLVYLDMFANDPAAAIPAEIGKATKLKKLSIFGMSVPTVPKEIGNLSNLEDLNLSSLKLQAIPKELGQLKKLQRLVLANNNLSAIPAEITNLPDLYFIDLTDNKALKEIPAACWKHPKLSDLWFSRTAVSQVPAEVNKNQYNNYHKKLKVICKETPLATQVEGLAKTFSNLTFEVK